MCSSASWVAGTRCLLSHTSQALRLWALVHMHYLLCACTVMAAALPLSCLSPAVSNPPSQPLQSPHCIPPSYQLEQIQKMITFWGYRELGRLCLCSAGGRSSRAHWSTAGWGLLLSPSYQMWCACNWSELAVQVLVSCNLWILRKNYKAVKLSYNFL